MKKPTLANLKRDFIAALKIISHEGLSDAFAHLSSRVDGNQRMLFMPRKSPALLREKDLFVVDFDKVVPQSTVHQAIYRARQDVGSVSHFHSPYVILLSVVGQTIRSMHNYSAIFHEGVPLFEASGQVESPERAAEIVQLLGHAKAILLRGHGAVVVGHTIPEACILALYLEESAHLQVEATKLGTPHYLNQEEAERVARRTFKPESNLRAWEHFKRKAGV